MATDPLPVPVLEARGLAFGYPGVPLFEGLALALWPGEVRVLLGPSGSGKTTLVHLLAGILRPKAGAVYWRGQAVTDLPEERLARLRRRFLGLVFQHHYLLPELTALENAILPGWIGGRPDPERGRALLSAVGLLARAGHLPAALSGGERQRVAVARALYHRPPLLLADEPTGALDPKNAEAVLALLVELARASGSALLLATHDERLVAGFPGWRIEGGRLVSLGA